VFVLIAACGSSSSPTHGSDATMTGDAAPTPTTTIAAARQAYTGTGTSASITVNAVVTAVQGPTGDQVIWYVEDPAGGAYSGISVFCDPLAATTCPCKASCTPHVEAPALNTLVSITGTISAYHGQLQLEPTAQTVLKTGSTPPPAYIASASDLAESATSPYQGVYVKFAGSATVDDLTPAALYDTECNPTAGSGMPLCSGCAPPTYAGFEVNGPGSDAFFVEETFFPFVPLASSPECTSQPGAVAVTMAETFPFIAGILDVDPYAMKQVLSPVQPSDY
jgi:predicted extracellular nuclease